jgi:predicted O-methyltransferase YrrM
MANLNEDKFSTKLKRKLNAFFLAPIRLRLGHGELGKYLSKSRKVTGFLTEKESVFLANSVIQMHSNLTVVEVGSFLGQSSIVFAGALKVKGSGKLHCIDPFDGSGDSFSMPFYERISKRKKITLREWFDRNVSSAGVDEWIEVHQGTAETIGVSWRDSIDILFLDGDQSPQGARKAYETFLPYLKVGSLIILHNSIEREYDEMHDGHYRLVVESIKSPNYGCIYVADSTTFARKLV